MLVLFNCCMSVVLLFFECCVIFWGFCLSAVWILLEGCVSVVWVLYGCCTSVQCVLCECRGSVMFSVVWFYLSFVWVLCVLYEWCFFIYVWICCKSCVCLLWVLSECFVRSHSEYLVRNPVHSACQQQNIVVQGVQCLLYKVSSVYCTRCATCFVQGV